MVQGVKAPATKSDEPSQFNSQNSDDGMMEEQTSTGCSLDFQAYVYVCVHTYTYNKCSKTNFEKS